MSSWRLFTSSVMSTATGDRRALNTHGVTFITIIKKQSTIIVKNIKPSWRLAIRRNSGRYYKNIKNILLRCVIITLDVYVCMFSLGFIIYPSDWPHYRHRHQLRCPQRMSWLYQLLLVLLTVYVEIDRCTSNEHDQIPLWCFVNLFRQGSVLYLYK